MTQTGDGLEVKTSSFVARAALRHLQATRSAYSSVAEVAESAVQHLVMSIGPGSIGASAMGGTDTSWNGLRNMARQSLIAFDTNVKASFDCVERLLQATSAAEFLAIQTTYLRAQSQRSGQQIVDLHRIVGGTLADGEVFGATTSWGTRWTAPWVKGFPYEWAGRDALLADRSYRRKSTRGVCQGRFHDISYVEWGEPDAARVIVCVHGLTRQARDFDILAAALAAHGYRVICPDVVGRGHSGWLKDPEAYGLPQYASDMGLLIAHLGVETVDWIGTSMGGMIGMALAAAEGTPIRRLVVNDIGPFLPHAPVRAIGNNLQDAPARYASVEEAQARLSRIHAAFGPLTDLQWRHLTEHSIVPDGGGGFRPHYDPGIGDAFRPGRVYDVSLWEMWDAIVCPVLLLRGETSELLLAETAQEMTVRGPRARLVTVPGCGHAPALLEADQVGIIVDWLGEAG